MTRRTAASANDTSPISQTDRLRIEAEERMHAEHQRRTARVVAAAAQDAEDCRMLLDILGLDTDVVAAARIERATSVPRRRRSAA
ncbi:hypothetical protein [Jatrophihabitans sp.]|uniref:hypothetical protein n=1 Tax=Jatrophihabitans sp. TaxID=1932789 RepID=UPI0030C6B4E2|nr:hypothetical protein [Jatrophihabitans sp.]